MECHCLKEYPLYKFKMSNANERNYYFGTVADEF